jgi:cell division protease FtsH
VTDTGDNTDDRPEAEASGTDGPRRTPSAPKPTPTAPRGRKPEVKSGLAKKRRNPVLAGVGGFFSGVGRFLRRDALATMLLAAVAALLIAFFVLLASLSPAHIGGQYPLSRVLDLARAHQIADATLLDYDDRVVVDTYGGQRFYANYPTSGGATQLVTTLSASGARVAIDPQSHKQTDQILVQFLIPILLLVCLFAFFMRLSAQGEAGGIAAFSKFGGKGRRKGKGTLDPITFDDVAGAGEAVAELREIRDYLADPTRYLAVGAAAPKGVLLVGPPGTGKTLLAKAVAGEANAAYFSLSGSEFVESLVGVGAARVRDLFRKARKAAPAIIFIDELDAAGRKRGAGIGQGNDEREQTLNQILVEMDGFGGDAGLVVIAATNRPDILDPALLRPGRFDRQVTVDVPDVHGRMAILRLYGKRRPLARDASLDEIARLTPGFSGAELANVINEAALLTVRSGRTEVTQAELEEAIDRVIAGPAKAHKLSSEERRRIAIHEASHAVATEAIGQATAHRKLSIVARGRQLGTAAQMLTDRDAVIHSRQSLDMQLVATLAGAAGERLAFGDVSTGVHDDLHSATGLARRMITSYGMSDVLGPVTIGEAAGEVFLGASLQDLGNIGPTTLDIIDREVERVVGDSEARATHILQLNWASVTETANALLEHETLSGVALDAVLSAVTPVEMSELEAITRSEPDADPRAGGTP